MNLGVWPVLRTKHWCGSDQCCKKKEEKRLVSRLPAESPVATLLLFYGLTRNFSRACHSKHRRRGGGNWSKPLPGNLDIYCGLGLSPVEGAVFGCDLVEGDGFLWWVV